MVKEGSTWRGSDFQIFTVIHRVVIEGKTWIHYRNNKGQEFSCYEEAFVQRFTESVK